MDLRPLRRHRDFRWLYTAQSVSFLGTMVTYVALPYQMFQLTGSSLAVGLLGLAELLPLLVTAFVGGALADTMDRRRMILVTEVGLGLGSGALALTALASAGLAATYLFDVLTYAVSLRDLGRAEGRGLPLRSAGVGALLASLTSRLRVLLCGTVLPRFVAYDARA